MSAYDDVHKLLKQHGAKLIRSKKHNIWRLPSGKNFVTPQTPSDTRGWHNAIGDLRRVLGIVREPSEPKVDRAPKPGNTAEPAFLADIKPAEERPVTPEGRQPTPEPERETIAYMGRVPLRHDRHAPRGPIAPRAGPTKVMSEEVRAQAQFILQSEGVDAMTKYLNGVRTAPIPSERKEVNTMSDSTLVSPPEAIVRGGSLESAIAEQRKRIKFYRAQEEQARTEALRAEQLVAVLEQALEIQSAPRDRFLDASASSSTPRRGAPAGPKREHGFWTRIVREVVGTSPMSLTKTNLVLELKKQVPDAPQASYYAALTNELKQGRVVLDPDQFVRLAPEKVEQAGA